jgi:hypothetical protein
MIRIDFPKESKIVEEDFSKVIKDFGGKAAGLLLANKIFFDRRGDSLLPDSPKIPKYFVFRTALYEIAERILREKIPKPLDRYKEEFPNDNFVESDEEALLRTNVSRILFNDEDFMQELERGLRSCRNKFKKDLNYKEAEFYLRSSTTIEDFVDDRYYGTFKTLQRKKSFKKSKRGEKLPLVYDTMELIKYFYAMKYHTDGYFELNSEESLGMVFMPSIPGLHVISYSSYPEIPNSPVIHEVSKIERYSNHSDPKSLALIRVHGNTIRDIEVIPATSNAYLKNDLEEKLDGFSVDFTRTRYEFENPFEINDTRSPLSLDEIRKLTRIARTLEGTLEYSVNTELKLVRNDYYSDVYLLQLRPVPTIKDFSPLQPFSDSQHVLAETPFVYGSFRYEAPIILTEDKNIARAGISIPKPVIVWDSESHKGHRLFWGNDGDNCLALINLKEGRTLSHEISIFPSFGKCRDKFHMIGVPQLYGYLQNKLNPTEYHLKNVDRSGKFRETPFPVIIESDGRQGRVSIDKRYLTSIR